MHNAYEHIANLRTRLAATADRQEKLGALLQLSEALRPANAAEALEHAEKALGIAHDLGYESETALCEKQVGLSLLSLSDYDKAKVHLDNAYRVFKRREEYQLQAEAALAIGETELKLRRHGKALEWFGDGLNTYRSIGDRGGELRALRSIGNLHAGARDDLKALELFHRALRVAEELGDRDIVGTVESEIATVHEAVEEHVRALEYFSRSRESFKQSRNHYLEVRALTNIARAHLRLDQLDQALAAAERASAIYADLGERASLAVVLEIIGHIYEKKDQPEKALDHHRKELDILTEIDDEKAQAGALLTIGKLCQQMGDHQEASLALEEALHVAEETADIRLQHQIHERLAITLKRLGNYEQALEHYERFAELREGVLSLERQQAIAELQVRFDLEHAENEKKRLQRETEQGAADLSSAALALNAQHELIKDIRLIAEKIERSPDGETKPLVKDLLRKLKAGVQSDDSWQQQLAILHKRHPGFMDRLVARCPVLTKGEQRVCALTRMNMSAGEIASILGTGKSNIENRRNGIRKKLGIAPTTRLEAFLESL